VLKTFSEGELLARLPFMNIAGSGLFDSAEQELPSVGFRAVNEGYSQSCGVVDQRAEAVHLFGGDVDVDRSIVDLMGPEARASQGVKRPMPSPEQMGAIHVPWPRALQLVEH